MRLGDTAGDRKDCAGEGTGTGAETEPDRGSAKAADAESEPDGVGCCECGWKRALDGVGARSEVLCCDRWLGVELDGGAPDSAMGTSAGGVTARGALADDEGDGRTGVWCAAGDSCVC
jgi:hypothetical protein